MLIIKSLQSLSSALQSIRFLEGGGLVKGKKKQVKQVRLVRSLNSLVNEQLVQASVCVY